jgi:hypothetical protein
MAHCGSISGKGCTILYHDRMPVLLEEKDVDGWLDGSLGPEVLKPSPESALREWMVSKRMNRTGEGDDAPRSSKRYRGQNACSANLPDVYQGLCAPRIRGGVRVLRLRPFRLGWRGARRGLGD